MRGCESREPLTLEPLYLAPHRGRQHRLNHLVKRSHVVRRHPAGQFQHRVAQNRQLADERINRFQILPLGVRAQLEHDAFRHSMSKWNSHSPSGADG